MCPNISTIKTDISVYNERNRRRTEMKLKCLAVLAGSLLISGAAIAEYPERPIKLIIGYSPGGAADAVARIYSAALADKLGQPVVIENRPGAGSTISSAAIAKADPDGYTLGMASGTLYGIDKYVYNVSYSPDDFTPIMRLSMSPLILAVGAESDINTFPEFFEKAKANPGTMFYSSSGIGGSPQTSSLVLENAIGTEFTHVPYKGGARPCWQLRRGMWTSRLVRQHLCCRSAWAGK
ncbi:hypothetical protein DBV39_02750 [Orrella marina]|uniref:Uncharacterized protein n=2 Tax=Orrella marina TaxID=2163011 RepID=A0A2R4XG71_9BURK|nr:hypothetical protein DBV39_02750 [Orrella marina]